MKSRTLSTGGAQRFILTETGTQASAEISAIIVNTSRGQEIYTLAAPKVLTSVVLTTRTMQALHRRVLRFVPQANRVSVPPILGNPHQEIRHLLALP